MNEVIDLCSSDEEEELNVASRAQQSYLETSSDEEAEDDCKAVAATKPKKVIVTPDAQNKTEGSDDEQRKPNARRSLFAKTRLSDPWESDSSSDDELLSYQALTLRKKKSPQPQRFATAHTTKGKPPVCSSKENNSLPSPLPETKKVRMHSPPSVPNSTVSSSWEPRIENPYAKRPASSNTSDNSPLPTNDSDILYPTMGSSSHFDDLRAIYLLAFWKYAQEMEHASYNLIKLDTFSKRVNALALSHFPIRSFEEYCQRFSGTMDTSSIEEALRLVEPSSVTTKSSRNDEQYFSVAEACLVSMLAHVESEGRTDENVSPKYLGEEDLRFFLQEKKCWVFLSDLLPMIDRRLKDICPGRLTKRGEDDNGASYYTTKSTRSTEYKQIEKLQSKQRSTGASYIKAHKQQGKVCFELTTVGYKMAKYIQERNFPSNPGHYRTSNLVHVEPRFQGISLAVDNREGGGPKKKLHAMCNKLDMLKIPYFVCPLSIGDYCFFAGNKLLPVLIERKSIQDVAQSIFDGRWVNQKKGMYQGQYVFGYKNCCMAYIIEGRKESQQLSGGYMGQRQFNVSGEKLDEEIENLESEGFEVLRTQSPDHSMVELSRWATRVLQDYRDKKFQVKYSFDEFQQEVRKIPKTTDFSRIARDMAESRRSDQITTKKSESSSGKKATPTKTKLAFGKPKATTNKYKGWTVAQLQKQCAEWGLPKSGKKVDLIERLNGPRPPKVLLERKARDCYVPSRYNTCAAALLVALWLEQRKAGFDWNGMRKEELFALAESLDISKDPFSGVTTGSFKYDGWSSMSDLKSGELPLVVLKQGHFKLTTSTNMSGFPLAEALHGWCHEHEKCSCQALGYD